MNNILVTGANGQLGSELKAIQENYKQFNIYFADRNTIDITKSNEVSQFAIDNNINAIINCAAYTAVDKAEDESSIADEINHKAVDNLAKVAKKLNIKLVHISTDYVFDGKLSTPYEENANTAPLNIYGKTKLNGELSLINVAPKNSVIIRTSWVYSSFGSNFVKTMLRLSETKDQLNIIFDQIGSPTYARDLARHILDILPKINNQQIEIYHYTNEGVCSWYDFATAIFDIKNRKTKTSPISTSEYPTKAIRPNYSVLNKKKIKSTFDIEIRHWQKALKECLSYIHS